MSEISATISNFVDSAEKIYTLAMRIKDDLTKYSQVKKNLFIKVIQNSQRINLFKAVLNFL
jgi:hypothetical protein